MPPHRMVSIKCYFDICWLLRKKFSIIELHKGFSLQGQLKEFSPSIQSFDFHRSSRDAIKDTLRNVVNKGTDQIVIYTRHSLWAGGSLSTFELLSEFLRTNDVAIGNLQHCTPDFGVSDILVPPITFVDLCEAHQLKPIKMLVGCDGLTYFFRRFLMALFPQNKEVLVNVDLSNGNLVNLLR